MVNLDSLHLTFFSVYKKLIVQLLPDVFTLLTKIFLRPNDRNAKEGREKIIGGKMKI